MALVKCPECGKENVSDQAVACPECGYVFKKEKSIKISKKVLLIFSIIYTICALGYALEYIWCFESIAFLSLGLIVNLSIYFKDKIPQKLFHPLMVVVYVIGAFLLAFNYNIGRLDLDFIDGMFSSYIYKDSLGVVLAIYQLCAMVSVIIVILQMFTPHLECKIVAVGIFVSSIMGFVFNVYNKIYLESGYGHGSAFYIWLALVSLFWFLFYMVYTLSISSCNENKMTN